MKAILWILIVFGVLPIHAQTTSEHDQAILTKQEEVLVQLKDLSVKVAEKKLEDCYFELNIFENMISKNLPNTPGIHSIKEEIIGDRCGYTQAKSSEDQVRHMQAINNALTRFKTLSAEARQKGNMIIETAKQRPAK
jgi:hypothetical protein